MGQSPAPRYAQAIFQYCQEAGKLDSVYHDFHDLLSTIDQSIPLKNFLANKGIDSSTRMQIFKNIFQDQIDSTTLRCLHFLEHKGRIDLLEEVCEAFELLYQEFKNILHVHVVSSCQLTDGQNVQITEHLKTKFKKNIETEVSIDKDLLGGLTLQIRDVKYDYSFRSLLNQFKHQLIHQA